MYTFKQKLMLSILLLGAGLNITMARAAIDERAFGEIWQSQGSPAEEQSQVIYYRAATVGGNDASLVYVDSELQAALLPGMFTRFCVKPGKHTLGAYRNDAPAYKGKSEPDFETVLKGGKTYYVHVDAEINGRPQAVKSKVALAELRNLRLQKHALSRASSVEACRYSAKPIVDYTLSSDVIFKFAKSDISYMQPAGREAIENLMMRLQREGMLNNRIEIIGHTDNIGSESRNQQLGAERAISVRQLMIHLGVPAQNITTRSMGSSQPITQCDMGTRLQQIECNAPNRRVVVRVETSR